MASNLPEKQSMADTKEKFSGLTVALHWVIALAILGALAYGMWIDDLPRGELKTFHVRNHKTAGMLILALALLRIGWRATQGFPKPVAPVPAWEKGLSHLTHALLLVATVAMPLSGIYYSEVNGHAVSVFGVEVLPQWIAKEAVDKIAADRAFLIHGTLAWCLIGLIALHLAGVLKHVFVSKDGTLRRMLGARVPVE